MTEHVYVAPNTNGMPRRRGPFIPPLLIIPFLAYNVIAFLFLARDPAGWNNLVMAIPWYRGCRGR